MRILLEHLPWKFEAILTQFVISQTFIISSVKHGPNTLLCKLSAGVICVQPALRFQKNISQLCHCCETWILALSTENALDFCSLASTVKVPKILLAPAAKMPNASCHPCDGLSQTDNFSLIPMGLMSGAGGAEGPWLEWPEACGGGPHASGSNSWSIRKYFSVIPRVYSQFHRLSIKSTR